MTPPYWHSVGHDCKVCSEWRTHLDAEQRRWEQHLADVALVVALAATVDDRDHDENAALDRLAGE